jgi:hypothetical protein
LLAGLRNKSTAADILQQRLGERLARAFWRMDRADRMQDGYALRQAKEVNSTREGRLHAQMMRLKMTSRNWELLAESVEREHYVTTGADLEMMRELHADGVAKETSEVALALFHQLREPGTPGPGDPAFADWQEEEKTRQVMTRIRSIFGLGAMPEPQTDEDDQEAEEAPDLSAAEALPGLETAAGFQQPEPDEADTPLPPNRLRHPEITEAQWEAREPVRQLLENILRRQVEIFEAQRQDMLRQILSGPSVYERAAEIAPPHPHVQLMQKMEDSNCRQVLRMTSLLIRLRRHERQMESLESAVVVEAANPVVSKDV